MNATTVAQPEASSRRAGRARVGQALGAFRGLVLVPIIVVIGVWAAISIPAFFTFNNIVSNILVAATYLGIVVIAETMLLIGGYMDVSLQSIVGLAPMVAAWLVAPVAKGGLGIELNPVLAVIAMFALGGAVGAVNGVLVARLKMPAFIVTLAMLILLQGFMLGISGGKTFSNLPELMLFLGAYKLVGVPLSVWLLVMAFVLAAIFMRMHPTGRRIYALGGNPEAARAAGIRTQRLTIQMFVVAGMLAALGGVLLSARIASVTANQGANLIFTVFAASVIGGVTLTGGRGTMMGAFTGVILLGMIQNILILSDVPAYWIDATYGAIILGALLVGSTELRSMVVNRVRRPGTAS